MRLPIREGHPQWVKDDADRNAFGIPEKTRRTVNFNYQTGSDNLYTIILQESITQARDNIRFMQLNHRQPGGQDVSLHDLPPIEPVSPALQTWLCPVLSACRNILGNSLPAGNTRWPCPVR